MTTSESIYNRIKRYYDSSTPKGPASIARTWSYGVYILKKGNAFHLYTWDWHRVAEVAADKVTIKQDIHKDRLVHKDFIEILGLTRYSKKGNGRWFYEYFMDRSPLIPLASGWGDLTIIGDSANCKYKQKELYLPKKKLKNYLTKIEALNKLLSGLKVLGTFGDEAFPLTQEVSPSYFHPRYKLFSFLEDNLSTEAAAKKFWSVTNYNLSFRRIEQREAVLKRLEEVEKALKRSPNKPSKKLLQILASNKIIDYTKVVPHDD